MAPCIDSNDSPNWNLAANYTEGYNATWPCETAETRSTFFSCDGENSQDLDDSGARKIDVSFDYEIYTPDYADITSSVEWFQSDLLEAVAREYGLILCESVRRKERRTIGQLRKKRELGDFTVMGLSSDPDDSEDPVHEECLNQIDTDEPSICTPINGHMTAWLQDDGSERRLADSAILDVIQKYITNKNDYDTEKVITVNYIGERYEADGTLAGAISGDDIGFQDESANSKTGLTPGIIVLIVALATLFVIAVTGLGMKKLKERKARLLAAETDEAMATSAKASQVASTDDLKVVDDDNQAGDAVSTVNDDDHTDGGSSLEPCSTFDSEGGKTRDSVMDSVALSRIRSDDGDSVHSMIEVQLSA